MHRFTTRWTGAMLALLLWAGAGLGTVSARDLAVAVLEFNRLLAPEEVGDGISKIDLRRLEGKDRIDQGTGEMRNGRVLFYQRMPLVQGNFRQATSLGVNRLELDYRMEGGQVRMRVIVEEGMSGPVTKTTRREFQGQGTLQSGRPTLLQIVQASGANSRSGRSGYQRSEFERTRILLVQEVR